MSAKQDDEFFVAFFGMPPKLRIFLISVATALIAAFGVLAYAAGASQDNPGEGAFRFDFGRQTVTGVLELNPYPIIRVVVGSEQVPAGRTLMMSGAGKLGLMSRAAKLDGQIVTASGVLLQRGDLDMLQVRGGAAGLSAAKDGPDLASLTLPAPEPLGRWRLAGEMCDGKCLAGAMRPGRRLAHKACANLCVIGGVPPVFVSSTPVEGDEFMLMAGPDGGPLTMEMLDHMAAFVTLEGDLERRGDMLILKMDPASVEPI
ncbi:MAG: hypothetical protein AAF360_10690 [Pseudomonadota bacterium]